MLEAEARGLQQLAGRGHDRLRLRARVTGDRRVVFRVSRNHPRHEERVARSNRVAVGIGRRPSSRRDHDALAASGDRDHRHLDQGVGDDEVADDRRAGRRILGEDGTPHFGHGRDVGSVLHVDMHGSHVGQARSRLGQGLPQVVEHGLGLGLDVTFLGQRAGDVDQAIGLGGRTERERCPPLETPADFAHARLPPDT